MSINYDITESKNGFCWTVTVWEDDGVLFERTGEEKTREAAEYEAQRVMKNIWFGWDD